MCLGWVELGSTAGGRDISGSTAKLNVGFTPSAAISTILTGVLTMPSGWNTEATGTDALTYFIEPIYCKESTGPAVSCSLSGNTLSFTFATEAPASTALSFSVFIRNPRLVQSVSSINLSI